AQASGGLPASRLPAPQRAGSPPFAGFQPSAPDPPFPSRQGLGHCQPVVAVARSLGPGRQLQGQDVRDWTLASLLHEGEVVRRENASVQGVAQGTSPALVKVGNKPASTRVQSRTCIAFPSQRVAGQRPSRILPARQRLHVLLGGLLVTGPVCPAPNGHLK